MIMVPVQAANLRRLFPAFHLSVNHAVFAAVAHLQSQSAVGPELALGAEAMRRLHPANQHRRANRTQERNRTQQLGLRILATLHNHVALGLAAQLLHSLQLLIEKLCAPPESARAYLRKILVAMLVAV